MIKNQIKNNLIAFFTASYLLPLYLLLLSGFPTIDAIKVCSMIFLQIVTGGIIWNYVSRPLQFDLCETLGIGFSIGSVLSLISHQITLKTPISDFGWTLPTIITLIFLVVLRASFVPLTLGQFNFSSLLFLPFSAALILKQWWWLAPISILFGLVFLFSKRLFFGRSKSQIISGLSVFSITLAISTVLTIDLRKQGSGWWIRSWDVTYFESKAFSIAKFGFSENISLVGYPMDYHWFSNAWIGTLTVVCKLHSWLAIANVAPTYSALAISCLIWTLGRYVSTNKLTPTLMVAVLAFGTSALSPSNPPNIIAMIWAIAALFVSVRFFRKSQLSIFVIFFLLAVAALAGKVSAGFLMITTFVIIDFFTSLKTGHLIQMAIRATILFAASLLVFFWILGGPNRLGNNRFRIGFSGLANVLFGVESNRSAIIVVVGTVGALLIVFQLVTPLAIVLYHKSENSGLLIHIFLIWLISIGVFSLMRDDGMVYFLSNSINFTGLGAGIAVFILVQKLIQDHHLSKKTLVLLSLFAFALGKLTGRIIALDWRNLIDIRGGPAPILLLIVTASLCVGWITTHFVLNSEKDRSSKLLLSTNLMAFSVFLVGVNTLPNFFDYFYKLQQNRNQHVFEVPFTGSSQVNQASDWVRSNTGVDDVFAINRFCITKGTIDCIDPKYFAVSATAQRRILVEGPYYIVGGPYFSDQENVVDETKYPRAIKERLDLSRDFADAPTAEITARLKELGVGWFYLFLDNTTNRDWSPYATVEYQNDEVVILKLVGSS